MKHLTIIVPDGPSNLSSIVGTHEIFIRANEYWKATQGEELFKIALAGISKQVTFSGGSFIARPDTSMEAIHKTDLIIIPSLNHDYQVTTLENKILVEWIRKQYKDGAEIASICAGAFMLASSGLLDGKTCSTHWIVADAFRTLFPQVHLQTDKLITDEKGIYTNGGAFLFSTWSSTS
ncbi:DJ-1/PfpI family protein [Paraflavitalea speifideaquila]|uniref:DJ-1/PfpI family protein n=1 Tax=Paraflavitalea speifideaquila TaxID=3076558 RepID=UPI0028EFDF7E|nr:DJ-1/PfpI family protein [Paraflavitalea speifideiaquila]